MLQNFGIGISDTDFWALELKGRSGGKENLILSVQAVKSGASPWGVIILEDHLFIGIS
jgi:hypothetical protein